MRIVRALGTAGLGLAAYSLYEPFRFRATEIEVPMRPGSPRLSILHVSDAHMKARDRRLQDFLRSLPEAVRTPDLVLATGDLIEENEGIQPLADALQGLAPRYGAFYVLGSHDYYLSERRQYFKYFTGRRHRVKAPRAATDDLKHALESIGWVDLTNRVDLVETSEGMVRVSGVDDPYLHRHRTDHIRRGDEVLAVGLVHAPDVVSEWALHGFDLVVAGHTHGGQVQVPGIGAVVTNCSLPNALAAGLNRIGDTYLHVSPGLGNGRFAPIRFGVPPEVTLLRLQPS